jgi:Ser/Thr protein kinase RdoA (MazF antagonist)
VAATSKRTLWRDEPDDPGRLSIDSPDVRRRADEIAPGAELADLGGTMSVNVGLWPAGLVLRVHQPFVSRARLAALQAVRRGLAEQGLRVAAPMAWRGATLFRCGRRRWAELEPFLEGERPPPTPEAYAWMFRATGALHRGLADLDELAVPRPAISTYGPPSSLARWLAVTEPAVRHDLAATETVRRLRELVGRLRACWVPATALPVELVHGDVRLGNVRRASDGEPVYLDFGFLARRPRVHELAYSLAWIVLRPDGRGSAGDFDWSLLPDWVAAYQDAAGTALTDLERRALAPYTAAVPLYLCAIAGFMDDPVGHLRNETRLAFLRIAEWLLANPDL